MHPQRVAQVQFAHLDAAAAKPVQRLGGLFVLEREVAGVVVDAEVFAQAQVAGPVGFELPEEREELGRVLNGAEGFRFEAQVEFFPVRRVSCSW